jgi:quinohemoprotein ethanol dehydrogenase
VKGQQYVLVAAGYAGALSPAFPATSAASKRRNYGRLVAFALGGGKATLPADFANDSTPAPPTLAALAGANADKGMQLFLQNCVFCHAGRGRTQRSAYPDLHRLDAATHAKFEDIVLRGAYKDGGMASFADILSTADARDIHAFLVREQGRLRDEERATAKR